MNQANLFVLTPQITAEFSTSGAVSLPHCRDATESSSAPGTTATPQPMLVKKILPSSNISF